MNKKHRRYLLSLLRRASTFQIFFVASSVPIMSTFCTGCCLSDIISNCCTPHLQSVCLSNVLATLTDTVSQPPVHNATVMDCTPAASETAGTRSRRTEHTGNTQLLSIILTRRPEKRKHLIHKKHSQDVEVKHI